MGFIDGSLCLKMHDKTRINAIIAFSFEVGKTVPHAWQYGDSSCVNWTSLSVCVCARACAHMCACARVCMCARLCVECARECVCVFLFV